MPAWADQEQRMFGHDREGSRDRSGNPIRRLEDRSIDELYKLARQLKVEGRSRMTKEQLVEAVRDRR